MDSEIVTSEVLRLLIASKERIDKRKVSESRSSKAVTSSDNASTSMQMIANTCGSSMLTHGNTLITCAITTEVSPVLPSTPDRGFLQVDVVYNAATCYAMPRSDAATLQPSPDDRDATWASEASHILQTAIETSNVIDLKSLLIAEGEGCFVLKIYCVVMQDDGGVLEACGAAIHEALKSFQFPTYFTLPDGSKHDWETPSETKSIFSSSSSSDIDFVRLSTVGFLFAKQTVTQKEDGTKVVTRTSCSSSPSEANEVIIVVDPNAPEAVVCDGLVTVAITPSSSSSSATTTAKSTSSLVSVNSHGGKPATMQVLEAITKFVLTH